ncbi:hypothetical protein [Epilithonimonas vandammei]|uniref:hypothetical protein n=1 Tax=Epilithonimonas vandammei TaxID=2487072 RepID=UPI0028AEB556|nr:hypothetical protein [Epilithonimonas vandammei]
MIKCYLCKSEEATQKNSHIVPKFLGISLVTSDDGKRKGYKLDISSVGQKLKSFQDTPKEDFILCPKCENKFSKIERKSANEVFKLIDNDIKKNQLTKLFSNNGYQFITFKNIDYVNFKKLLYSILWRAQISKLEYFSDLSLPDNLTENFRKILNDEMEFVDIPIIVLTTVNDNYKTKNYIYANSNLNDCFFWMNEFLVFYDFGSDNVMYKYFKDISITENENVKIGVLPLTAWDSIRKKIIDIKIDLLKKKNII